MTAYLRCEHFKEEIMGSSCPGYTGTLRSAGAPSGVLLDLAPVPDKVCPVDEAELQFASSSLGEPDLYRCPECKTAYIDDSMAGRFRAVPPEEARRLQAAAWGQTL